MLRELGPPTNPSTTTSSMAKGLAIIRYASFHFGYFRLWWLKLSKVLLRMKAVKF